MIVTTDTVTDAKAVTALEIFNRDWSSCSTFTARVLTLVATARTARDIGAVAALKVCTRSRN